MSKRTRLLAWLGGVVLLAGAVIVLRATDPSEEDSTDGLPAPVVVDRFAEDMVVLPEPGHPPAQPLRLVIATDTERLRVFWADGLAGGEPLPDVVGYEVGWERLDGAGRPGTRLVAAPDVQLDGLVDGQRYRVRVRSVDGFGQRSAPTEATGVPGSATQTWRLGLTGLYDDFANPATVAPGSPSSRWHVYGTCAGRVAGRDLRLQLGCDADMAVLRARSPLRLRQNAHGELGRVAVRTDAAGPGGELTIDLVPGRADRVGVTVQRSGRGEERDPALPGGTVRVSISDAGVLVSVARDVPAATATDEVHPPPRRGPGVTHLFEVVLTTTGVRVYQDGLAVAARNVRPAWREASVLLGFRGPDGRRSWVHVSGAGFSGPQSPPPGLVEARVRAATRRVLGPAEEAPRGGVHRAPLVSARSARVVATLAVNPELDPNRVVVQLGGARLPARPAVAVPSRAQGAALTVVADVPAALLGPRGPATITSVVVRAPGADQTAVLLETYLEITPGPGWRHEPADEVSAQRLPDALPVVVPELGNAAGEPLESRTVPRRGQVVLIVRLDAAIAQWDTGAIAGVQGFRVSLDGDPIAGMPTAADGPGVGGVYAVSIAVGGLELGGHTVEVREYGMDGVRVESTQLSFTVVAR